MTDQAQQTPMQRQHSVLIDHSQWTEMVRHLDSIRRSLIFFVVLTLLGICVGVVSLVQRSGA